MISGTKPVPMLMPKKANSHRPRNAPITPTTMSSSSPPPTPTARLARKPAIRPTSSRISRSTLPRSIEFGSGTWTVGNVMVMASSSRSGSGRPPQEATAQGMHDQQQEQGAHEGDHDLRDHTVTQADVEHAEEP